MFQNIIIGNPICSPAHLFANNVEDWETNEKNNTLFTTSRFLPVVLKEAGVVSSTSEVKRNKPELMKDLTAIDFFSLKWGKKIVHIAVGE